MSRKVLVTGGCGFIGSNLVHSLYEGGFNITVVDDLSTGNLENLIDLPIRVVAGSTLHIYESSDAPVADDGKILIVTADFAHDKILQNIKH